MELSSFSENIVIVPYVRGGETVELSVNIDAFTPEFFREVGKRFKEKRDRLYAEERKPKGKKQTVKPDADHQIQFFEDEARALEINREIYAELLSGGVLLGWTITENGVPVEPSYRVLVGMPPRLVQELWRTCVDAAQTVKKREDVEIEETLENSRSGSRAPLALAPTG